MKTNKLTILGIATVVVLLLAIVAVKQKSDTVKDVAGGALLFPNLKDQVNSVNEIVIVQRDKSVSVKLEDSVWKVPGIDNYPADLSKIKQTIIKLADMKIIEAKTQKEDNYSKIGVEDPSGDKAKSKLLTLKDKDGKELASVIVGNQRTTSVSDVGSESLYVRKSNDRQSWLVKGELYADVKPKDWIDSSLLNIAANRVQKVTLSTGLTISKDKMADKDYVIEKLPAKKQATSDADLKAIAESVSNVIIKDAKAKTNDKAPDFSKDAVHTDIYMFDGLVISVDTVKVRSKYFAKYSAKFDPSARKEPVMPELKEGVDPTTAPTTPHGPMVKDLASTQQEAAMLNTKFEPWIFEISTTKGEHMRKTITDVTKNI